MNLVDVQEADLTSTPDMDETISYDDTDSNDSDVTFVYDSECDSEHGSDHGH